MQTIPAGSSVHQGCVRKRQTIAGILGDIARSTEELKAGVNVGRSVTEILTAVTGYTTDVRGVNMNIFLNFISHFYYSVKPSISAWGPNMCFLKKEKSNSVQRNPKHVNNGPIFAGSIKCSSCKCGVEKKARIVGGTEVPVRFEIF